jgi:hypothetical protein
VHCEEKQKQIPCGDDNQKNNDDDNQKCNNDDNQKAKAKAIALRLDEVFVLITLTEGVVYECSQGSD